MFESGSKKIFIVVLLLAFAMFAVSPVCGAAEEEIGVLVVAHGSNEASWNGAVQEMVEQVKLPYPVELGFLEFAEPSIDYAVEKLENQGVNKIIAVPLFISTYSNHIEEIKYVLGLRDTLPGEEESTGGHDGHSAEEEELTPVETQAEIVLTPALDDHMMVAEILAARIKTVSENPGQEIAVLVGHGSDTLEGQKKWRENFTSLADQLKNILNLKDADYGFVAMGEPAVRDTVSRAVYQGDVVVVPVMLSEGYFTDTKIPRVLDGLEYRYPEPGNRALTPHTNISRFIELRVNDVVLSTLQVKKDGDLCQINYTDVALESGGKICVCASSVFRSMQVAFNELWKNDIPQQNEIKVVAHHPTDGTEDALDIIAGSGNYTIEGTVENAVYATPDNYIYLVTNKVTGQTLKITARPEIFPENFFDLRAKVKNKTATSKEKEQFQKLRSQMVEKLRWEAAEDLFTWQLVEINQAKDQGSRGGGSKNVTGKSKNIIALTGGSVTYGNVTVEIPAGTLPENARISVNKLSSSNINKLVLEGLRDKLSSDIYEITISGQCDFGDKVILFSKNGMTKPGKGLI